MPEKYNNLLGQTFGRLTVIQKADKGVRGSVMWLCKCVCGKEKECSGKLLRNGRVRSCGCIKIERIASLRATHNDSKSVEFHAWQGIKARCYTVTNKQYPYYGGRGIKMCDRWLCSYTDFLKDMGRRPSPELSLDRIDTNGNYEPSNCRWATDEVQTNNRRTNNRVIHNGETLTLAQWARKLNIRYYTFSNYRRKGFSEEDVVRKFYKNIQPIELLQPT